MISKKESPENPPTLHSKKYETIHLYVKIHPVKILKKDCYRIMAKNRWTFFPEMALYAWKQSGYGNQLVNILLPLANHVLYSINGF